MMPNDPLPIPRPTSNNPERWANAMIEHLRREEDPEILQIDALFGHTHWRIVRNIEPGTSDEPTS